MIRCICSRCRIQRMDQQQVFHRLVHPFPIGNYGSCVQPQIISDTVNWDSMVEGNFVADSAYQHIVLGNFFDNAHTDTTPSEIGFVLAYFLIDSVSVTSAFKECTPTGANPIIASNRDMVYSDQVSGDLAIEPQGDGPGETTGRRRCLRKVCYRAQSGWVSTHEHGQLDRRGLLFTCPVFRAKAVRKVRCSALSIVRWLILNTKQTMKKFKGFALVAVMTTA